MENTKAQKMRTMETHKHTQALTENTVIPKEGACERPTTIPIKAHFQTVDSSLITSHFYTDKKGTYIHLTVVFIFLLTKIKGKE